MDLKELGTLNKDDHVSPSYFHMNTNLPTVSLMETLNTGRK